VSVTACRSPHHQEGTGECYCMQESVPSGMVLVLLHANSLHHQERHWQSSHQFQDFPYQCLILSLAMTYNALSILANLDNGAILELLF
jgi:hypothetical protein